MPKIPAVSPEKMIRILETVGFAKIRQKGSHIILKKGRKLIVVPLHKGKPLKRGLVRLIIKEAEIDREAFFRLLDKV